MVDEDVFITKLQHVNQYTDDPEQMRVTAAGTTTSVSPYGVFI